MLLCISGITYGQKSLQDIAEMKDKQWNKLVKDKYYYTGQLPQLEGLISVKLLKEENTPDPKEIGVLTFQLWDESTMKSQKAGNWVYYEKNFLSEDGSNIISNKIIKEILPAIKSEFTQAGINLLEPSEFIDNEEEREIYNNGASQVELSGIVAFMNSSIFNRLQGESNGGSGSVSADGYAFYPVTAKLVTQDFKAPASIGKITEQLGLDASLLIAIRVSIEKGGKKLVFRGFEMAVVTTIDDEKDQVYKGRIGAKVMNIYRDGLTMASSHFSVEPIVIADLQKKTGKVEAWYIEGIDRVAQRMTQDMLFGMKKFINRDKSKK
ncbi:MAG: hypothetical protein Roseis2KO_57810 [Roseivirga sp.]